MVKQQTIDIYMSYQFPWKSCRLRYWRKLIGFLHFTCRLGYHLQLSLHGEQRDRCQDCRHYKKVKCHHRLPNLDIEACWGPENTRLPGGLGLLRRSQASRICFRFVGRWSDTTSSYILHLVSDICHVLSTPILVSKLVLRETKRVAITETNAMRGKKMN